MNLINELNNYLESYNFRQFNTRRQPNMKPIVYTYMRFTFFFKQISNKWIPRPIRSSSNPLKHDPNQQQTYYGKVTFDINFTNILEVSETVVWSVQAKTAGISFYANFPVCNFVWKKLHYRCISRNFTKSFTLTFL